MAEKSLLTIVQEFCKRQSLPVPPVAYSATDDTTVQIVALLNKGIQDICDRYRLQQLSVYYTFVHANAANYEALDLSTAVADWKYNEPFTIWNTTTKLPIAGPMTIQEWSQLITLTIAPATYSYILYANKIFIYPVPTVPATTTFAFYYQSKYGTVDTLGVGAESYSADTSMPKVPTYLVEADIEWRWKSAKGLPYAEDMRIAESMLVNAVGRSPMPVLQLDSRAGQNFGPGIIVSPGSWPL